MLIFVLPGSSWARLAEEEPLNDDRCQPMEYHCYHRPPDECPPLNATSRCKVDDKCKFAVLCCNLSLEQIKDEFTRASKHCQKLSSVCVLYSINIFRY